MPDTRKAAVRRDAMPLIHSNGKSREAHIQERQTVVDALLAARGAMRAFFPHMRDYYPRQYGTEHYAIACVLHEQREAKIDAVIAELEGEIEILMEDDRG